MQAIHQLYATHCTYGTSALERREGEMGQRVLGYSARASSLTPGDLRRHYRTVERYLYYYVPSDAPPEKKLILTPYDAPRRLLFVPSVSGMQLAAQVVYRPWDAAHRSPGSYFAHVLLAERDREAPPWSILDCLKLWKSPVWTLEDGPEIAFDLPAIAHLEDALATHSPVIGDAAALSFLKAAAGGEFELADQTMLPDRWRQMTAAERQRFFETALRGLLDVAPRRRDSLLLIVEPSVSALFFYLLGRILPPALRAELSFSTYETNADRLCTMMAALTFDNPLESDIKPERYQRGGFVVNTWRDKSSPLPRRDSSFVAVALKTLLEQGWAAIDRLHEAFDAAGGRHWDDLEDLAALETVADTILAPPLPIDHESWQRMASQKLDYLTRTVGARFAEASPQRMDAVLASPPHALAALDLLAAETKEASPWQAARLHLLRHLPPDLFSDLLDMRRVAASHKVEALASYVAAHGQLPPGCERLWREPTARSAAHGGATAPALMTLLAKRLDAPALGRLQPPADAKERFFEHLLEAAPSDPAKLQLLTEHARQLSDEQASQLIGQLGVAQIAAHPAVAQIFRDKLLGMLDKIHLDPARFKDRLGMLEKGKSLLAAQHAARLDAWCNFMDHLRSARQRAEQPPTLREKLTGARQVDSERLGERLAAAMTAAAPPREFPSFDSSHRAVFLRHVGADAGVKEFLPSDLDYKIQYYHEHHSWVRTALDRGRAGGLTSPQLVLIGGGTAALLLLFVLFLAALNNRAGQLAQARAGANDSATHGGIVDEKLQHDPRNREFIAQARSQLNDRHYERALGSLDKTLTPTTYEAEIGSLRQTIQNHWWIETQSKVELAIKSGHYAEAESDLRRYRGEREREKAALQEQLRRSREAALANDVQGAPSEPVAAARPSPGAETGSAGERRAPSARQPEREPRRSQARDAASSAGPEETPKDESLARAETPGAVDDNNLLRVGPRTTSPPPNTSELPQESNVEVIESRDSLPIRTDKLHGNRELILVMASVRNAATPLKSFDLVLPEGSSDLQVNPRKGMLEKLTVVPSRPNRSSETVAEFWLHNTAKEVRCRLFEADGALGKLQNKLRDAKLRLEFEDGSQSLVRLRAAEESVDLEIATSGEPRVAMPIPTSKKRLLEKVSAETMKVAGNTKASFCLDALDAEEVLAFDVLTPSPPPAPPRPKENEPPLPAVLAWKVARENPKDRSAPALLTLGLSLPGGGVQWLSSPVAKFYATGKEGSRQLRCEIDWSWIAGDIRPQFQDLLARSRVEVEWESEIHQVRIRRPNEPLPKSEGNSP